jgi:hypothetical protein|tara:strand:+ start:6 stop:233 length:228 start_codon:yes stop_codon:yes gene_type:complete
MNKFFLFFIFLIGLFLLTGCSEEKWEGVDVEESKSKENIEDVGGLGADLNDLEGLNDGLNIDDLDSLDKDLDFDF